jgi:hypothetical protein
MRRLMANKRARQAAFYGVAMAVLGLTTHVGLVATVFLGLFAGLGWFAVYTWVDRRPRRPR